jgi:hypothetical protein
LLWILKTVPKLETCCGSSFDISQKGSSVNRRDGISCFGRPMKNWCFSTKPVKGNYHICIFTYNWTHLQQSARTMEVLYYWWENKRYNKWELPWLHTTYEQSPNALSHSFNGATLVWIARLSDKKVCQRICQLDIASENYSFIWLWNLVSHPKGVI